MLSPMSLTQGLPHPSREFCGRVGERCWEHNPELSPTSPRPSRFNLHRARHAGDVVGEAAPLPLFRSLHQSSTNRVAMNITQLLDPLILAPHRKTIVADLPQS